MSHKDHERTEDKSGGALAGARRRLLSRTNTLATGGARRLWSMGVTSASLARAMSRAAKGGDLDVAALEELVGALGDLKGLGMKAGQMLSYLDQALPEEARALLSLLQTAAPATPLPLVQQEIERALGPVRGAALVASLVAEPIAVASIGQVHRATLPDGTEVVVKVRHPGIREAMANELVVAGRGAAIAHALLGNVNGFIDEARATLLDECDYALEAERQRALGVLFAEDPVIVVPEVFSQWSAQSVLVTRFVPGRSLDDVRGQTELRDTLGAALFRFHVGSLYRAGLFHADPHPGNYAVTDDGRLVVYDFGCVRTFDRDAARALAALAAAARADDVQRMRASIIELGGHPPDDADTTEILRRFVRGFFAPLIEPGPHAVAPEAGLDASKVIRDKRALHRLALPPRMLFLFRLRFGLYAVLSRLGAVADWSSLEEQLAAGASLR